MRSRQPRYRVEAADGTSEWFDTADEAMKAVNQIRALRATRFVIFDENDIALSDQQLAMIVMEEQLVAARTKKPATANRGGP